MNVYSKGLLTHDSTAQTNLNCKPPKKLNQ